MSCLIRRKYILYTFCLFVHLIKLWNTTAKYCVCSKIFFYQKRMKKLEEIHFRPFFDFIHFLKEWFACRPQGPMLSTGLWKTWGPMSDPKVLLDFARNCIEVSKSAHIMGKWTFSPSLETSVFSRIMIVTFGMSCIFGAKGQVIQPRGSPEVTKIYDPR